MNANAAIHPTALIDPKARLDEGVSVGPFAVIGAQVEIGAGTSIGSHCTLQGPTRIGRDNVVHPHASLGGQPQDKKHKGEPTRLEIGDRNTIFEFTTFSRGTVDGGGLTRIGDDNWIMAYVHVAHDCVVGNHCILANNATLAGHVVLEDWVILGGFAGIHQFCRIGAHAFIGMGSLVNADVPPFVMVADKYAVPRGINAEGLKRRGFDAGRIAAIKRAYRAVFMSGAPLAEAKAELAQAADGSEDVARMLAFIEKSERGLLR
ncbi:MAG: acyl-ACP--UDP-N-acetylglucosamine O-acyltransferase [Lysobacteraceae bacterium]|jgi:UDP-N-acetylglucosamine acyltransferase|nr:acyl-ACP--UDP-N-acetylglucosamine O-acyltransferase [Xanthomonadaceae bacterium]MCZ8318018.1 acyl-ACP--UDP-N-acetylglucosamine O-acyltransferase [Silanimonas sp.]